MHEVSESRKYPLHKVRFAMGATIPDGNFGNQRIDVEITLEGKPDESPEATYNKARKFVEKKIEALAEELGGEDG